MESKTQEYILNATGASQIQKIENIQSLWAGHGAIQRIALKGGKFNSIILKNINMSSDSKHPKGWDTDNSYLRKARSYNIEIAWYKYFNGLNLKDELSRTPKCIACHRDNGKMFILLEDLDSSGFSCRIDKASFKEVKICLKWLANFHAKHLEVSPDKLWNVGTYWNLETRPDELKRIKGSEIYKWAYKIDEELKNSPFQTIVHGDAKIANFCFSPDKRQVSAVDFQYVGGGCGMKDVAYFIGSCLDEKQCEEFEDKILSIYFRELEKAIKLNNKNINFRKLKSNWKHLYHYAWTDFYRFLKGWSPEHWKINSYSIKISNKIIKDLESNNDIE